MMQHEAADGDRVAQLIPVELDEPTSDDVTPDVMSDAVPAVAESAFDANPADVLDQHVSVPTEMVYRG